MAACPLSIRAYLGLNKATFVCVCLHFCPNKNIQFIDLRCGGGRSGRRRGRHRRRRLNSFRALLLNRKVQPL